MVIKKNNDNVLLNLTQKEVQRIEDLKIKLNVSRRTDVLRYLLSDKVEIKI